MTFNIRYDNPADGQNQWRNRKENVISMVNFYNVDILCAQEVLKHQKDYLDSNLVQFNSVGVGREDGISKGEYSPIFYNSGKLKLVQKATFWLSETPDSVASVGWDAALERICSWAEFEQKDDKKRFFVFNTHFDHIGEQARINSAKLILTKIKGIAGNNPVVLTGDFNIPSSSEAYKIIISDEHKINDAQFIPGSRHHGPTWTFHGFETVELNKRIKIDHIFVSPGVNVIKHGILSDKFDGGYPSDHLPVLAEVSLN